MARKPSVFQVQPRLAADDAEGVVQSGSSHFLAERELGVSVKRAQFLTNPVPIVMGYSRGRLTIRAAVAPGAHLRQRVNLIRHRVKDLHRAVPLSSCHIALYLFGNVVRKHHPKGSPLPSNEASPLLDIWKETN